MKEKILMVGKLTGVLTNIHETIASAYEVQLCDLQVKSVSGLVKVVRPSMMIICTIGEYEVDRGFFQWIRRETQGLPAMIIANKKDEKEICSICQGSRFLFLSPPVDLDTILSRCVELMSQSTPKSTKKHILTIDDSPVVLRNVKAVLEEKYDVYLATGGEMGIKKAMEAAPDLILLDYEMPEMDGRETFLNLQVEPKTERIPVVFLTSVADRKRVSEVAAMHPAGYILKPIDAGVLRKTVKDVLGD